MMRRSVCTWAIPLAVSMVTSAWGQRLYVGIETTPPQPTRSTDLSGFPAVSWDDHFAFEVSGAAATPSGTLYLCNGPFTTRLYESTLEGPPEYLCTIAEDMSALAYGRGTLWGYSNYADPLGIYAIDPASGAVELVLDVHTGTSFRFFALDYNPADDMLYGYTEYGTTGLYRIDIDAREMTFIAGRIPASNGQGRGLAVGNNTVYLTATRGDDGIPYFAYDLSQGPGGEWVGFTNPYPNHHSTGAAAWIPGTTGVGDAQNVTPPARHGLVSAWPNPMIATSVIRLELSSSGYVRAGIYDVRGRLVAALMEGDAQAGTRLLNWNGRDPQDRPVPAGAYFVRIETPGEVIVQRIALIR